MDKQRRKKQIGASLIEYGMAVTLIAVVSLVAVKVLGSKISASLVQATYNVRDAGVRTYTCVYSKGSTLSAHGFVFEDISCGVNP